VKLEIKDLSFSYNSEKALNRITMQVEPALTVVIGPNAAGKSTLLKCLAGILRPEGSLLCNGRRLSHYDREELQGLISYLPQDNSNRAVLTVYETVLLGRLNSLSWRVSDKDLEIAMGIMENIGIASLAQRSLNELSGGQQQMVYIAQALVRNPRIFLLDEPTSNLDLAHQFEIFSFIKSLTMTRDLMTIVALHDLNMAARFADQIIVMNRGTIVASGEPVEVLTADMIRHVYGVHARVTTDADGLPIVTPIHAVKKTLYLRAI
jgi:iron complex transport system ATP-binding protein